MIRRILKDTDLMDIIRSIPSDVINNIEQVRYYVYGYENKFIAPKFTQEGDILKVIIPAEDLETLPDGLLYRKCFYNKEDADYPDGVYNLSITDNLELWIYSKEASVQPPIGSNFLQEDDLKTINGESLVGKGDIVIQTTAENIECGPVSSGLFNFSNVNEGLIQITGSVEEINNTKEDKKNIYYINVDYSTKQVTNTLQEIENIRQQLYSTNVYQNNLVYVRCNGSLCPVTSIQVTPFWMYITATFLTPPQVCYNICIIYEDGFINTYFNNIANKTDIPSLSGYATETWVESKGYLTEHQSLADYALKSEIPDVSGYALKSEIPDVSGYVQGSNLKTINGESIVGSGDITIQATGGVTEEWVNSQGYATETWVSNQGYLTEHQSLADYALKSEIPDVSGYALKTEIPDVSGYVQGSNLKTINGESIVGSGDITIQATGGVTEEWVNSQGYATETWVSNQGYLTEHQSLADYALKSEIPSLTGYATESWVNNQGYITSIPDTFATKDWVSTQGYLTEHQDLSSYALKSEIPSLTGYATETWVESKGYLTEHQTLKTINGESIVGEGNIVITGGSSEEVILIPFDRNQLSMTHQELVDNVLNKIDGKPAGSYKIFFVSSDRYYYEADTINITHNVSVGGSSGGTVNDTGVYIYSNAIRLIFFLKFEDIEFVFDEFAYSSNLEYLGEQISTLESRIPDLTGYATESWVTSQGYITSIPDTFATKTWVSSQGYLTEHQDLSSYALKSEIPDVSGYALKSEIPDVSGYALKSEIPSLDGYVQETNLKTINGESIVGSGDITIQATSGVTEEWVNSQGYATETWVSNQGYLTEHQSLAGYALKSEIPDVSGYALKTEIPDVSGYALKTEIPDVSGYALKTEIPDVSGYALKTEIPDVTGYATQTYVDNKIGQIDTLLDQMLG